MINTGMMPNTDNIVSAQAYTTNNVDKEKKY